MYCNEHGRVTSCTARCVRDPRVVLVLLGNEPGFSRAFNSADTFQLGVGLKGLCY